LRNRLCRRDQEPDAGGDGGGRRSRFPRRPCHGGFSAGPSGGPSPPGGAVRGGGKARPRRSRGRSPPFFARLEVRGEEPMNRFVVLVVLAAPAVGGDWQKRQSEFHAKAAAERKQLGLDSKAVRAKYPTPEVTFSATGSGAGAAGARCVQLCPGKT